jgi:L-lactate dehydrogenase (cytochrome)
MLALGADCTMIGRSYIYALAAQGQQGVEHLLDLYKKEIQVAMTLTGVTCINDLNRGILTNF